MAEEQGNVARRNGWANVNFPNGFVHPFAFQAKSGKTYEKMLVGVPKGVTVNGVDLGGWSFSVFSTKWAKEDKLNGRPVTIGLKVGEPVELFRGRGAERETLRIDDPWDLARAVKAHREAREAERRNAEETRGDESVSLAGEAVGRADGNGPVGDRAPEAGLVRGSLSDAAPQSFKPVSQEGMDLFNRCSVDVGFVARMDVMAERAARAFLDGSYDPVSQLAETRRLVGEMADAVAGVQGVDFGDAARGEAAEVALSASTDVINADVSRLADEGVGRADVIAANRSERAAREKEYAEERALMPESVLLRRDIAAASAEPPTMERCLAATSTLYGGFEHTDLLSAGADGGTPLDPANPLDMASIESDGWAATF
ncbi:sulfate adenylyltransferase, subunit 2 [Bifidobacterium lemurum]|uniref:Sulfate adenylyltransferase, subunit 2 n=1 Tax=Bifidobacterium lemurum TaxID=1603886 RepID=A0A261FL48_9BIFI|nr:hypothetical protein [Bifidobacterium lemurum]OZG59910.1 sulfate adenylyltransferase, subunit 2 [Bifidobacterium lemurum]QOL33936.1 hypothetical protein BL8807_09250 [Bifidobacterium lemurum]